MTAPAPADTRGRLSEPQVRAMFDRVARVYDLMNSVMTAGMHHRWRERAVDLSGVGPGDRAPDVATGTGDLAIALERRGGGGGGGGGARLSPHRGWRGPGEARAARP